MEPNIGHLRETPVWEPAPAERAPLTGEPDGDARGRIIALLSSAPVGLDDLTRMSGTPPGIVRSRPSSAGASAPPTAAPLNTIRRASAG